MSNLKKPAQPKSSLIALSFPLGLAFGFALEKGKVYLPKVITQQMLLQDFTMMKMFLSASATSMAVVTILSNWGSPQIKSVIEDLRKKYETERGIFSTVVGSAILGAGMAISGACPGTVFVQLGTGVKYAGNILAGGLLGSLVYGYIDQYLNNIHKIGALNEKDGSLDKSLKVPFWKISIPIIASMATGIYVLEKAFPYQSTSITNNPLEMQSWSPILAGMIVGSLNLPAILLLQKMIGSSTSFTVIVGKCIQGCYLQTTNYFKKNTESPWSWFQPIYLAGAVLGAYLSSRYSGSFVGSNDVLSASSQMESVLPLIGGFLVIFGSRLANGCTSGHGISGFSLGCISSLSAVPSIFAGGIGAAFLLKSLLGNKYPF